MRNPEVILNNLAKKTKQKDYKFERIYRNLYNPEFYIMAYGNIASKSGNLTPGVSNETIDGFNLTKIEKLIESLRSESYQPKPVKRVYIPKKNGKKRPLGIPTFIDKLLQEVIRMVLEAIYEENLVLPHMVFDLIEVAILHLETYPIHLTEVSGLLRAISRPSLTTLIIIFSFSY